VDEKWVAKQLRDFVEMTALLKEYADGVEVQYLPIDESFIIEAAQVNEKLMDHITPGWRAAAERRDPALWQGHRDAAIRALSELRYGAVVAERLGDTTPTMRVSGMHPWAWEGARSLWQSGHFGHAVLAALNKLNAEFQNKLQRSDLSETALFQNAFSSEPASETTPRLRLAGGGSDKSVASLRRGVLRLGEGCFAAVRNPSSHQPMSDISEQKALEQLALVSLLARWIDESERVTS